MSFSAASHASEGVEKDEHASVRHDDPNRHGLHHATPIGSMPNQVEEGRESSQQQRSEMGQEELEELTYGDTRKQHGVLLAEQAGKLLGKWVYVAWIGIGLTAYVTGLDNNIQYAAQTSAATQFGAYGSYTSLSVVQQVLIAVAKFPVAKLADTFGRAQGYAASLVFYVVGFVVMACSKNFATLVGGTALYAIGNTGTSIMQQIIVADSTSSRYRALSIGLLAMPYVVNFGCAPLIVERLTDFADVTDDIWRWIPGLFAIALPVAVAPVVLPLALSQRRAATAHLVPRHPYRSLSRGAALRALLADLDAVGLLLICAGWILILLPLNLAKLAPKGWSSGYIVAMLILGGSSLLATGVWESRFASRPVLRRDLIFNRDIILCAAFIGATDFMAFYLSWSPVFVWVQTIRPDYTTKDATYVSNIQSVSLSVFGLAFGGLAAYTRRYKPLLVAGAALRLVALGLNLRYRREGATTAQVVLPQLLSGVGGGAMGVLLQMAAQVATRHQNVAVVTAFVLLLTEIGGSIGTAILGALQSEYLLPRLERYVVAAGGTASDAVAAFGSPLTYTSPSSATPASPAVREAVVRAWGEYVRLGLVVALVVSAAPVVASLLVTDRRLGDGQNCVSDEPVRGWSGGGGRGGAAHVDGAAPERPAGVVAGDGEDGRDRHEGGEEAKS